MQWLLPLLSFHIACSAVRPSSAIFAGTNQSSCVCVVLSCSSKIDFSVGLVLLFCALTTNTQKQTMRVQYSFIKECLENKNISFFSNSTTYKKYFYKLVPPVQL